MMPRIAWIGLPENEHEAANALDKNLTMLGSIARRFQSAVTLCQETREKWKEAKEDFVLKSIYHHWPLIAAQSGALTLYDFWMTTQAINQRLLHRCPTVMAAVDQAAKKRAQLKLQNHFPDLAAVRNAAGHAGEFNSKPEKSKTNCVAMNDLERFAIGDAPIILSDSLLGDSYTFTSSGKVVSYEVTSESVDALFAIASE